MEGDGEESRVLLPKILNSATPTIPKPCRYFNMTGGCAHGESCHYIHDGKRSPLNLNSKRGTPPMPMVRSRKIIVSGLPSAVDSGDLYEILEKKFGPVLEAIVVTPSSENSGIVTFKGVDSVFAAVQAQHINILGKEVLLEARSAFTGSPKQNVSHSRNMRAAGESNDNRGETTSPTKESLTKKEPADPLIPPVPLQGTALPPWVLKLKEWLPKFLAEASARTKGQAYPLCSLKGDFRATCNLEMDHVSLGYEKLADFLRAMPEVVTLKTVPVGGTCPAMHIVLEKSSEDQDDQVQLSKLVEAIQIQQAQHSPPLSVSAIQAQQAQKQVQMPMGFIHPSEGTTMTMPGQVQGFINPMDSSTTMNMPGRLPVFYVGNNMFVGGFPGGPNVPVGFQPPGFRQVPAAAPSMDADWNPFHNWQLSQDLEQENNIANLLGKMA